MILLADSEGPDQTDLIWAFAVCICSKTDFCIAWPNCTDESDEPTISSIGNSYCLFLSMKLSSKNCPWKKNDRQDQTRCSCHQMNNRIPKLKFPGKRLEAKHLYEWTLPCILMIKYLKCIKRLSNTVRPFNHHAEGSGLMPGSDHFWNKSSAKPGIIHPWQVIRCST